MKTTIKTVAKLVSAVIVSTVLYSCSVQKHHYGNGYTISWNKHNENLSAKKIEMEQLVKIDGDIDSINTLSNEASNTSSIEQDSYVSLAKETPKINLQPRTIKSLKKEVRLVLNKVDKDKIPHRENKFANTISSDGRISYWAGILSLVFLLVALFVPIALAIALLLAITAVISAKIIKKNELATTSDKNLAKIGAITGRVALIILLAIALIALIVTTLFLAFLVLLL